MPESVQWDEHPEVWARLSGAQNHTIKRLEKAFAVDIQGHSGRWHIDGVRAAAAKHALRILLRIARTQVLQPADIEGAIQDAIHGDNVNITSNYDTEKNAVTLISGHRKVQGKTPNQRRYIEVMQQHDLTISVGPAGSGKTYLAVAMAVAAFQAHQVERIILTRPAVEAGEKLGFLPGDLQQKVDPYLRPLFDALTDMLGLEKMNAMMEAGRIEIAPLAYMRGRTLNDAFIILDEAQNTTRPQMKMFLTRLGFASKMVVTGDITQVDLPKLKMSGLLHALDVLAGVDDIGVCRLTEKDVVRHQLVEKIVKAYDKAND